MKKIPNVLTLGLLITVILFIWLYREERKKNALLATYNQKLQLRMLELRTTIKEIAEEFGLSAHTKNKLQELIIQFENLDEDIAAELTSALAIMKAGEYSKATATFVKIIEDILRKQFENDPNFKNKNRPNLASMIDYAKTQNIIDVQEYNFLSGLRLERNKEAHELNQNTQKTWLLANIHLGLEFICRFSTKFNLL